MVILKHKAFVVRIFTQTNKLKNTPENQFRKYLHQRHLNPDSRSQRDFQHSTLLCYAEKTDSIIKTGGGMEDLII